MVKRDRGGKEQTRSRWVGLAQVVLVLVVVVVAVVLARAPARVERVASVAVSGGSVQEADVVRPVVKVFQPSATAESLVFQLTGTVGSQRTVRLRSEVTGRLDWVSS